MKNLYDVVIVGGGPAGLTAALYLARARYRVLVLEKEQFGGQIAITHEVVNYPGIAKTSGRTLTDTIKQQAQHFGAEFMLDEVKGFDLTGDIKTVYTNSGNYHCFGILLATGAHPRTVGFKGEEEHKGRGVAYCATCDGEFFTGKEIFVIGGGYAAAEESVFLTKFARHITILVRKDDFSCAASVADQARNHEKITVLTNTVMEEVSGENKLTYARYKNTVTGEVTEYKSEESFGVFVFAGYAPATEVVKGNIELNEHGYIVTDTAQRTNIPGVYAAGDVCIKALRQVVTATSDGALAATELEKYVAAMQQKTGLRPKLTKAKRQEDGNEMPTKEISVDQYDLFTPEMRQQLETVFARMERGLLLKLHLDNRPISSELESFITSLTALTNKLEIAASDRNTQDNLTPYVEICLADGTTTGLAFHGAPGGHEFTSFVLGLYNAAGPGQSIDPKFLQEIASIQTPTNIKILVTLSCTMCPDLVVAAQQIAARNINISAHVYDLQHFESLKNQYNVMSVPCMIINDKQVFFGKKNIQQILELLKTQ